MGVGEAVVRREPPLLLPLLTPFCRFALAFLATYSCLHRLD